MPAGEAQPRNADTRTDRGRLHAGPVRSDGANDLVTRDDLRCRIGQLAIDQMQVGAAYPARVHSHQHLPAGRLRQRDFAPFEWTPRSGVDHGAHGGWKRHRAASKRSYRQ